LKAILCTGFPFQTESLDLWLAHFGTSDFFDLDQILLNILLIDLKAARSKLAKEKFITTLANILIGVPNMNIIGTRMLYGE